MLNALFGDPRLHLVQLHPAYAAKHGMRNFEKAEKLYRDLGYLDVKKSFQTGKHRRNAVTELLRFICSREFQVADVKSGVEDVHESAYKMLLNGDIVGATRTLSSTSKHSLADPLRQPSNISLKLKKVIFQKHEYARDAQDTLSEFQKDNQPDLGSKRRLL